MGSIGREATMEKEAMEENKTIHVVENLYEQLVDMPEKKLTIPHISMIEY